MHNLEYQEKGTVSKFEAGLNDLEHNSLRTDALHEASFPDIRAVKKGFHEKSHATC